MLESWVAAFAPIDVASLSNVQARDVAAFLGRYAGEIATPIEFRRSGDAELIVLDLLTGAPQAPVYPIRKIERIGLLFLGEGRLPFVVMLRDDFPDTEHQQLVPDGYPSVICIDDRPWAEARLTWTPAELLDRIISWFRRAARGELHDARQPLDPILIGSTLSFLVARSVLDSPAPGDLVGEHDQHSGNVLRVKLRTEIGQIRPGMEPMTIAAYRVPPENMKRLRRAPTNLAGLSAMLNERGIDLLGDLRDRFAAGLAAGVESAWFLNGRFAVIVEMPILSPRDGEERGVDTRAFVTAVSAGDIAVALGIALKQKTPGEGSKVGYVKAIGSSLADANALAAIVVQSAEVHLEFERSLAARLAGRAELDARKAVLVGAGAIGSHVADCLVREGRFTWTVIDDDRLLPHNLARHIGHNPEVPRPKAIVLAGLLNATMQGGNVAQSIVANLFSDEPARSIIDQALAEADIIIDATASVLAERALSDHQAGARRLSVFFNPSGESVVLLAEAQDRSVTLRDIEAQYLGLILRTPRLADHLGKLAETVAYTGACRAITNRIPESRAAILSGLAASAIATAVDRPGGDISIWTLEANGAVNVDSAVVEEVQRFEAHGWTITLDAGLVRRIHGMRNDRLPVETGGILFGSIDIPAKRIHLVDARPAPPDSIEKRTEFVRGVIGVEEAMNEARRRTAGQVRYIGEWHSHPPKASARPSSVDALQIDWLAGLMGMDSVPALMVIAADKQLSVIFAAQRATPLTRD
ncbi:ThiF family adenylyltransferase (plasmid) [Bradyrhizobium sp. 26S5]|uniref:ThiF family adenylyltransferase n=1 Tax=Bradyrhizobium sp. 26S5 TaxID=3139729 RepID=UPI0030CB9158